MSDSNLRKSVSAAIGALEAVLDGLLGRNAQIVAALEAGDDWFLDPHAQGVVRALLTLYSFERSLREIEILPRGHHVYLFPGRAR